MKTIGIIAEFNPFHKGHLHLIEHCKNVLNADKCVVIMSGDFVQRGAPAIVDKFSRAKMALLNGADIVLELPVYYSLASAEYFAFGAVSILDKLGVIDYLCFGSECGDIDKLSMVAETLNNETPEYKEILSKKLKEGLSFASARQSAVSTLLNNESDITEILSSPNNILAVEYIRALKKLNSKIIPYTTQRIGEDYNSEAISNYSSATAIRQLMEKDGSSEVLSTVIPKECAEIISDYDGEFAKSDALSSLLSYKLILEKENGYTEYLDINQDISNKILSIMETATSFDALCASLKSKDIAYSRISRFLLHILLNIKADNMEEYKSDGYTGYARILGAKKESSDLIKQLRKKSSLPVIGNLKEANTTLLPLQRRLFSETLCATQIYNQTFKHKQINEFRMPLLLI